MAMCVQNGPVSVSTRRDREQITPFYTRSQVRGHCDVTSCWIIVQDKVYDITRFLLQHPGGEDLLLEHAGLDASAAFWDKGHSSQAHRLLAQFYIGDLREEPTPKI